MNNAAKPTKTEIKQLRARVAALETELSDAYTVRLGPAAVKCVQESLDAWKEELARRLAI